MALEIWETLKEAIPAYTGLSPATFFTILAVGIVFFHAVYGFFGSSETQHQSTSFEQQDMEPLPPPVQVGQITEDELKEYDGSHPNKPLLMAIKGQIYDVSQSRMFYGPGGPYALFAGKDASRALAKMSFEDKDLTGDISGLGPFELEALQDWEYKFMTKYVKVGTVKTKEVSVTEGSSASEPTEAVESTSREAPSHAEDGLSEKLEESPSEKPVVETAETSAEAVETTSREDPNHAEDGISEKLEESPLEKPTVETVETSQKKEE